MNLKFSIPKTLSKEQFLLVQIKFRNPSNIYDLLVTIQTLSSLETNSFHYFLNTNERTNGNEA